MLNNALELAFAEATAKTDINIEDIAVDDYECLYCGHKERLTSTQAAEWNRICKKCNNPGFDKVAIDLAGIIDKKYTKEKRGARIGYAAVCTPASRNKFYFYRKDAWPAISTTLVDYDTKAWGPNYLPTKTFQAEIIFCVSELDGSPSGLILPQKIFRYACAACGHVRKVSKATMDSWGNYCPACKQKTMRRGDTMQHRLTRTFQHARWLLNRNHKKNRKPLLPELALFFNRGDAPIKAKTTNILESRAYRQVRDDLDMDVVPVSQLRHVTVPYMKVGLLGARVSTGWIKLGELRGDGQPQFNFRRLIPAYYGD